MKYKTIEVTLKAVTETTTHVSIKACLCISHMVGVRFNMQMVMTLSVYFINMTDLYLDLIKNLHLFICVSVCVHMHISISSEEKVVRHSFILFFVYP